MTRVQEVARQQASESEALTVAGRVGLVARGLLHLLVGLLTLQIASGNGDDTEANASGALAELAQQPFGRVLVGLTGAGLACYALWRLVEAGADTERAGTRPAGLAVRLARAGRGLLYGGLAVVAFRFAVGAAGPSDEEARQEAARELLGVPGGRYIVVAAGLVVIGIGAWNAYKGVTRRFGGHLRPGVGDRTGTALVAVGAAGYGGRAVAFLIAGAWLVRAGATHDPNTGVGLDSALRETARSGVGTALLIAVAAGLLAFAVFLFASARYRRVTGL